MINPCKYFSIALLLLFSSTHAYSTSLAIGSMNITRANSVGIGGGGTGQVQFDIDAFYIGPNTNLVGGYIGSGGAGFASDELNPDSIIAFDFAGEITMVYSAAANLGDSGAGPNSEQLPSTIDGGVVPFGTLDATAGTISMDLTHLSSPTVVSH